MTDRHHRVDNTHPRLEHLRSYQPIPERVQDLELWILTLGLDGERVPKSDKISNGKPKGVPECD